MLGVDTGDLSKLAGAIAGGDLSKLGTLMGIEMPGISALSDLADSMGLPDLSGITGLPDLMSELGGNAAGILGGTMNSVIDTSKEAFNSLCSSDFANAFSGQISTVFDINGALNELFGSFDSSLQGVGEGLSGLSFGMF